MNIIERYYESRSFYDTFDLSETELKPLIQPMVYNRHIVERKKGNKEQKPPTVKVLSTFPDEFDEWIGLRPAGHFFAYGRPVVWIRIVNNTSNANVKMRNYMRGFYVTIRTVDDSALYAEWVEPLTQEQLKKILEYFDVLCIDGLDTDVRTMADLDELIGVKGSADYS